MTLFGYMVIGYVLFILLNLIDLRLTQVILNNGGREFNPLMRFMHSRMGMIGMALIKLIFLSWFGLQLYFEVLDLYTIYYLDFSYTVVLIIMYIDGHKEGLHFSYRNTSE